MITFNSNTPNQNKGIKLVRQYHPNFKAHTIYLVFNGEYTCTYTNIEIIRDTKEFKKVYERLRM